MVCFWKYIEWIFNGSNENLKVHSRTSGILERVSKEIFAFCYMEFKNFLDDNYNI